MPVPILINGNINYVSNDACEIVESTGLSSLLIDVPPQGAVGPADAAAAADFFARVRGVPQGGPIGVLGIRGQFQNFPAVLVIRA